jgi:DNA polymerase-1
LDAAGVTEKFGVPPERIADYLALVGDTSDNIPGLRGVGPKTAVKWLMEYGSLEGVLAAAGTIQPERFREQILAEADRMRSNLGLVTFRTDYAFEPGESPPEDISGVEDFLATMEMYSTLKRYQTKHGRSVRESQSVEPKVPEPTEPQQGELF